MSRYILLLPLQPSRTNPLASLQLEALAEVLLPVLLAAEALGVVLLVLGWVGVPGFDIFLTPSQISFY